MENGEKSPYLDWFHVYGFPMNAYQGKPNYSCWWNLPALPQFNTDNPQVRKFLFEVAKHWIEQGADGWRLDVPFEIKDESFWRQFGRRPRWPIPTPYLVGEIPSEAQDWLQGDMFDGCDEPISSSPAPGGFLWHRFRDEAMISGMMGLPEVPVLDCRGLSGNAPRSCWRCITLQNVLAQLNLLDSHDTPAVPLDGQ